LYLSPRDRVMLNQGGNSEPIRRLDGWKIAHKVYGHYVIVISRPKANPDKITFVTVYEVLLALARTKY